MNGTPTLDLGLELRRKSVHVTSALISMPILLLLPFWSAIALGVAAIAIMTVVWAYESGRLPVGLIGPLQQGVGRLIARTRRAGEDYPWSPVLYTVSLCVIAAAHRFVGLPWSIAFAAYAILGLGDTASAFIGMLYGRRRIAWNASKSLECTMAGLIVGFLAGVGMGSVPSIVAGLPKPRGLAPIVFLGAVIGALVETLPDLEDNVTVPLASAAAMFAAATAAGLTFP